MNTGGATLLGNANNAVFELFASHHHKVRHLVDDNDNVWHLAVIMFLFIIVFVRDRDGFARLRHLSVIVGNVLDARILHFGIAALHFLYCPLHGAESLSDVSDNWRKKMRNCIISGHFNLLWIDDDKLQVGRRVMVEHRHNQSVSHDGLTRTGSTSDEKVRHLGEVT